MDAIFQIPTTEETLHYAYLLSLNSYIGLLDDKNKYMSNHLTPRELDVLAEIMKLNEKYSSVELAYRAKLIHSSDSKKTIRETLELDYANFNNVLTRVAQKVLWFNRLPLYNNGILNPILDKINRNGLQFRFQIIQPGK
jgi:hypothetical protein